MKFIPKGNIIVTDDFSFYHWLDDPSSGYVHSVHNHSHGNFGYGFDSTSHIESLWSNLKTLIKSFYIFILDNIFLYFFSKLNFEEILKNLIIIILWKNMMKLLNMLMMFMDVTSINLMILYPIIFLLWVYYLFNKFNLLI